MEHEHPNALSSTIVGDAGTSNAPTDILQGQHHPWRRFYARFVDINTVGLICFFFVIFACAAMMPEHADRLVVALENPLIATAAQYLVWLPVEALFLAVFGTTPAKWLFGIRVADLAGQRLSLSQALTRSMLVFVQGVGLGVPLVSFLAQFFAFDRLSRTGTTLWDTASGAVVNHEEWGVFRKLVCIAAVLVTFVLIGIIYNW